MKFMYLELGKGTLRVGMLVYTIFIKSLRYNRFGTHEWASNKKHNN